MKFHANAALSFRQRERMVRRVVEQGWSLTKAAEAAEVSERTCSKWVGRFRVDGMVGLGDRSWAPRRVANRTAPETVEKLGRIQGGPASARRQASRATAERGAPTLVVFVACSQVENACGQACGPVSGGERLTLRWQLA
jgi:transposase